jgi:putative ABC transport system ATP-binding protein
MALLQELWRAGMTVLMVTHEADIAAYASRVVVMKDGLILSDTLGTAQVALIGGAPQASVREAS